MNAAAVVFRKELVDALRERRTWLMVLVTSLVGGPASLLLLALVLSQAEEAVARREVLMEHAADAPTLVNFLRRGGAAVSEAPPHWREQVADGRLRNAVVVVGADFETALAHGQPAQVDVVFDSSQERARAAIGATLSLMEAFNREAGTLRLLARGVDPAVLRAVEVEHRDVAGLRARSTQLLFMVPWFTLLISVGGILPLAIDLSAGERERGSLEPLLANPVPAGRIVVAKWGVVALAAAVVVALTLSAYGATALLIDDDTLAAQMQFGSAQALRFAALLLPFSAAMGAVLMVVATLGRTYKEAQTYASQVMLLVNVAPIATVLLAPGPAPWKLPIPGIGQLAVLSRILRGDAVGVAEYVVPALVCAAIAFVALLAQARLLRNDRIVFGNG